MRKLLTLVAVVGMVSAVGCKKDEESKKTTDKADTKPIDTKPADTKPTDTKPTDTKPVDTKPEEVPGMANKMEHCPADVAGSKTTVEDGEGVVIVTTISTDAAATADIRKRSAYLVGLNDVDMSDTKHSGNGTGGGGQGMCPVAVGLAKLASEDVEGGTKITMTPRKEGGFAGLSAAVKKRAKGMAAGGHEHGGGGGGGHEHGGGTGGGKHHGDGSGGGGGGGGDKDNAAKKMEKPTADKAPAAKAPVEVKKPSRKKGHKDGGM